MVFFSFFYISLNYLTSVYNSTKSYRPLNLIFTIKMNKLLIITITKNKNRKILYEKSKLPNNTKNYNLNFKSYIEENIELT